MNTPVEVGSFGGKKGEERDSTSFPAATPTTPTNPFLFLLNPLQGGKEMIQSEQIFRTDLRIPSFFEFRQS